MKLTSGTSMPNLPSKRTKTKTPITKKTYCNLRMAPTRQAYKQNEPKQIKLMSRKNHETNEWNQHAKPTNGTHRNK